MPSMSAGLSPASAIALSAASACSCSCDMSGITPSFVVSDAPTTATALRRMDFRAPDRTEHRQRDPLVELLERDLERHVQLERFRGLWTVHYVAHHARSLCELYDGDRIGWYEARHRPVVDQVAVQRAQSTGRKAADLARGAGRTEWSRREIHMGASLAALQAQLSGGRTVPEIPGLGGRFGQCACRFRHRLGLLQGALISCSSDSLRRATIALSEPTAMNVNPSFRNPRASVGTKCRIPLPLPVAFIFASALAISSLTWGCVVLPTRPQRAARSFGPMNRPSTPLTAPISSIASTARSVSICAITHISSCACSM